VVSLERTLKVSYEYHIIMMERWPTFAEAVQSKLNPLLPKGRTLPIWTELNEALSIFKYSMHIIPERENIIIPLAFMFG
jgi:hypothetical protein